MRVKWAARCAIVACLVGLGSREAIAQREQPTTTVILVRHDEREALSTPDPPLTAAGRLRAGALLAALRGAGVQSIIVTQVSRTAETAQPLAAALAITPEIIPDTGANHAAAVARAILEHHAGETVLVVGHGHTVPAIMRALGATLAEQRLCESQYDLLFIVWLVPARPVRFVRATYGAPAPPDTACARSSGQAHP